MTAAPAPPAAPAAAAGAAAPGPGVPPVAAHLLTGFLGSGKTTLLRRLLRAPGLERTAVLLNEFGEVGLDHLLVEPVDEDVVLLSSGCVCCTIRGDLKEATLRLFERRRLGEIPAFERLAIETTGLADPAPILATFANDRVLRHQVGLGAVVTVVDALTGEANLARFDEARRQAAVADRLVVSKTDLAPRPLVDSLRERLRRLNPLAELVEATADGPDDPGLLFGFLHDPEARAREARLWFDMEPVEHRHGLVASLAIEREAPLDWAAFALWLGMLLNRHGAAVLRVKGVLRITGSPTPVVVHGVQHTIHPPLHLEAWPDGRPRTRLVLIVDGLDLDAVRRSFEAFMRVGEAALAAA